MARVGWLTIPVIAGLLNWATNQLAVKMMFYPLRFRGFNRFFGLKSKIGWVGIVPGKAKTMANSIVDDVILRLIDLRTVFARLPPEKIAAALEPVVIEVGTGLARDLAVRKGVASEEIQFTKPEDAELVSRLYEEGFLATVNRVAAQEDKNFRSLAFEELGWGDEEGAVLVEALRYAAERCTFPQGSVKVVLGRRGNHLTDASAGEGAAVWKELEGKFHWHL